MDSKVNNILNWVPAKISYQCFFGELRIYNITLDALKSSPNIFEIESQIPVPLKTSDKVVSHSYSLPCDENLKAGIKIKDGYIQHVVSVYRHFFVSTSAGFDDYLSRFKGKTLNSLKRKLKKVEKSNREKESCVCFQFENDVEIFLDIAKSISEKSYQEKLLGRSLPTGDEFIIKLKSLAASGNFRGYILYAEDTPIAYNLCPIYGDGIMLYDYTGYDPEYSRYSAGTVLQYNIIEQCFSDPNIHAYDLCTGEGKHKEFFANGSTPCCDVYFFPVNARFFLLVYSRYLIESSAKLLIGIMDKAGIKNRIKTFIRRLS